MAVPPAFDIGGGLPLALARAVSVAAMLSQFRHAGVPRLRGAPGVRPRCRRTPWRRVQRRLLGLTRAGLAAGLLALLAWLVAQAADIAPVASVPRALAAVPVVLADTAFGHLDRGPVRPPARRGPGRAGGAAPRWRFATGAGARAAGRAQPRRVHGPMPVRACCCVAEIAHLLGAAAWLGGLVPLLLVVQVAPARAGALAARWFSPMGKLCVVALAASALVQGWVLVGSIPGLVGTAYGWMALGKLGLFGVLFSVRRGSTATASRRRCCADAPAAAKRTLVRSIAVQTGFGLATVAAAAVLGSLPPAMHEPPM